MDHKTSPSSGLLYPLVLILALGLFALGLYLAVYAPQPRVEVGSVVLGVGCLGVIATLVCWPIASHLSAIRSSTAKHQTQLLDTLSDRLQQVSVMLNVISEQQLVSDRARAVAYRGKDRETLRRAIVEEMAAKDWEAARALVDDMESIFGYRQEAQRFREQIETQQMDMLRRQVSEAAAMVDRHCRAEEWESARTEARRVAQLYPQIEQATRLPAEVDSRKGERKRQLLADLAASVDRHDVDASFEIIRMLDAYLTPAEVEDLRETARNVGTEKRQTLAMRFKLAVQQHKYAEALRVGDELISDFPNSRYAQEVREMYETLRQRATERETAMA